MEMLKTTVWKCFISVGVNISKMNFPTETFHQVSLKFENQIFLITPINHKSVGDCFQNLVKFI